MELPLVKGNRIGTLLRKVSMKGIQYTYTRSEQKLNQMAMMKIGRKIDDRKKVKPKLKRRWENRHRMSRASIVSDGLPLALPELSGSEKINERGKRFHKVCYPFTFSFQKSWSSFPLRMACQAVCAFIGNKSTEELSILVMQDLK